MPTLAVVDDREERRIVADGIRLVLPDGWDVLDTVPLSQMSDYPSWIMENEVVALIIDERLDEAATDHETVLYNGHDLVDFLRKRISNFPIFIVTSYPGDEELEERFKDVEAIIPRRTFNHEPGNFVPRILRASQQFLSTYETELAELSEFAKKSAIGEAISEQEIQRAKAIQAKLGLIFEVESISTRSEWLSKMETLMDELDTLRNEIEKNVNKE